MGYYATTNERTLLQSQACISPFPYVCRACPIPLSPSAAATADTELVENILTENIYPYLDVFSSFKNLFLQFIGTYWFY